MDPDGPSELVEIAMSFDPLSQIMARFDDHMTRLDRLERLIVDQRTIKDFYSVGEVAEMIGRAKFTVSEWCRLGRVEASKRPCGRSGASEWMIAHAEVERVKNEGLRPDPAVRRPMPPVGR